MSIIRLTGAISPEKGQSVLSSVSVIVVNFNGYNYTRKAVESVLRHAAGGEIIIVDNNSIDRSQALIPVQFPQVKLVCLQENRGFGPANNVGASHAGGQYLFFLNNDTLLLEDTPGQLARCFEEQSHIGICGPKIVNEDGTFQVSFGRGPSMIGEWKTRRLQRRASRENRRRPRTSLHDIRLPKRVDWVTGAALMIPKNLFRRIGGFDEQFFMYFEDVDLCRRVAAEGYQIRFVPETKLVHFGGMSVSKGDEKIAFEYRRSQIYCYTKHTSLLEQVALRSYLAVKFLSQLLFAFFRPAQSRDLYRRLIKLALAPR